MTTPVSNRGITREYTIELRFVGGPCEGMTLTWPEKYLAPDAEVTFLGSTYQRDAEQLVYQGEKQDTGL